MLLKGAAILYGTKFLLPFNIDIYVPTPAQTSMSLPIVDFSRFGQSLTLIAMISLEKSSKLFRKLASCIWSIDHRIEKYVGGEGL